MKTRILLAATIATGLVLAPAAFAMDDMSKDKMDKKETMSKPDGMKKSDGMMDKKDSMAKDTMSKDKMSK
jgi:pentapeptide MXKDX repeat protein